MRCPHSFPVFYSKGPQSMDLFNLSSTHLSYKCRNGAQGERGTCGRREQGPWAPNLGLALNHPCSLQGRSCKLMDTLGTPSSNASHGGAPNECPGR